jgi:hypothetical protein
MNNGSCSSQGRRHKGRRGYFLALKELNDALYKYRNEIIRELKQRQ